jgi:pimeloyl-ACP methyl ester carboxylesterase
VDRLWILGVGTFSNVQKDGRLLNIIVCTFDLVRSLAMVCDVIQQEYMIPGADADIKLYLRNKRAASSVDTGRGKAVLCIHGSTYPGHVMYDVALDGVSWMDYMAGNGCDVFSLDIRGFGRSSRPIEMYQDPLENDAIVDGVTALRDISSAVEFILQLRGVSKVALIGWSWGTALVGAFAEQNPERVDRIVQIGPMWFRDPVLPPPYPGQIPAYRIVRRDKALDRWLAGVSRENVAKILPVDWSNAVLDAAWQSDPEGLKSDPPYIRAPNGFLADSRDYWRKNKPYYDAAKISVPVLLLLAEWDLETPPYMAHTLFSLLVNSPDRRIICFKEGTHMAPLETGRMRFFSATQSFLVDGW